MMTRNSELGSGKLVRKPEILRFIFMNTTPGFMKHLPNLLKQESSSAATLVHVLLRMYYDPRPEHQAARPQIAERILPFVLSLPFFYPGIN